MTELPAAISFAIIAVIVADMCYAKWFNARGLRLSRFEQWLQHLRYQADNYDGERMFAAGLCVVVLVAILAGAG
jgi:hypothetical protein